MSTLADLLQLLAAPLVLVPSVYLVRLASQRACDRDRAIYRLGFPRKLNVKATSAFLATLAGLATPRVTLAGRDTAVLEVVSRAGRLEHYVRLPRRGRRY